MKTPPSPPPRQFNNHIALRLWAFDNDYMLGLTHDEQELQAFNGRLLVGTAPIGLLASPRYLSVKAKAPGCKVGNRRRKVVNPQAPA